MNDPGYTTSDAWLDEVTTPSIDDMIAAGNAFRDMIPVVTERRDTEFYVHFVQCEQLPTSREQRLLQSVAVKPLTGLAKLQRSPGPRAAYKS